MRRGQDPSARVAEAQLAAAEAQLAAACVYSPNCACGTSRLEMFIHNARTDAEAARVFLERKALYLNVDEYGQPRCNGPRYWIVHGPGGHLIAVRYPTRTRAE